MSNAHVAGGQPPPFKLIWLVPIGMVLIAFTVLLIPMLHRHEPMGAWSIAVFLVAHGLIHAMFLPEERSAGPSAKADNPFSLERSWLISRAGLSIAVVRPLGLALIALTIGGYVLAAAAAVGLLIPAELFAPLLAAASLASMALLVVAFAPALLLGLAIDAVLVWLAFTTAWLPGSA